MTATEHILVGPRAVGCLGLERFGAFLVGRTIFWGRGGWFWSEHGVGRGRPRRVYTCLGTSENLGAKTFFCIGFIEEHVDFK